MNRKPLILYIVRHGEAEPKNGSIRDEQRRLSPLGSKQLRNTLGLVKQMNARIDRVISSPLQRAKDSSDIVAELFLVRDTIIADSLEPESTPSEVYNDLSRWNPKDSMALVTHQPLVTTLLQDLLGVNLNVDMKPASVARVDIENYLGTGAGRLVYLFSGNGSA